ncbi:Asp-tRNA(Asn)/Glu-tRNA(Gln) amidotransferase subunit GatB [Candidatus Hepatincolaceae symbiont of Richtersius coronifer]
MSYFIEGKEGQWEIVIGLEVHCQILSNSKLFSGSSASFGGEPNAHVSFIDAGFPGVLPRPNKFCIEQAIKTGLALKGEINLVSYFDRKHYFYPDLPLGYQISQFYKPIMLNGSLSIDLEDGTEKVIRIERLHIEQDAGKLLHDYHPTKSLVDLNRAGVGLMEIVSHPDMRSKEEAATYVSNLRTLVRTLGTCDGNMEEGSLRCDVNISVRKPGEDLRTRVEVKNVNSIRFIQQAIAYETQHQVMLWESGKNVVQETKLFDAVQGKTYSLRKKEDVGDYRYVRDPDILPVILTKKEVEDLRKSLPELPQQKQQRFCNKYNLNKEEAKLLTSDKEYSTFFEEALVANSSKNPKLLASMITSILFAYLNKDNIKITESKISPQRLAEVMELIEAETISFKTAKDLLNIMWTDSRAPKQIVEEKGLGQITDFKEIESLIDELVATNLDKIEQIKQGKEKVMGWFTGQIMKETQGKVNPDIIISLLKKKILE